MEILTKVDNRIKIKSAVFDFDGTLSKLRSGWESVMEPMMCELIPGEANEVKSLVKKYIDESTGIQTILQMRWLAETIEKRGKKALDPWAYKAEYLKRLMIDVDKRKQKIQNGEVDPSIYKVFECEKFLSGLQSKGIKMYAASGTDEKDVKLEAKLLGLDKYFTKIKGAVDGSDCCCKEAVLKELVKYDDGLMVVGDGKVEIALGKEKGAFTIGVASNDVIGCNDISFNMQKYERLKKAGADIIVSDFRDYKKILEIV